jgi:hypothetical protein
MNQDYNVKKYTIDELYDIHRNIDRYKYPERYILIEKEIKLREESGEKLKTEEDSNNYNQRKYINVVMLFIFTMGLYIFYWYYINLKEVSLFIKFNKNDNELYIAKELFIFYMIPSIILTFMLFPFIMGTPLSNIVTNPFYLILAIVGNLMSIIFQYFYLKTISTAKIKVKLKRFSILNLLSLYIFIIILNFIDILKHSNLKYIGSILFFIYIYKIQKEINHIWQQYKLKS